MSYVDGARDHDQTILLRFDGTEEILASVDRPATETNAATASHVEEDEVFEAGWHLVFYGARNDAYKKDWSAVVSSLSNYPDSPRLKNLPDVLTLQALAHFKQKEYVPAIQSFQATEKAATSRGADAVWERKLLAL